MTAILDELITAYRYNAGLRYDFLDSLSDEELHREWPRPGLDTFGKQLQEMAAVNLAGAQACRTGTLDLTTVPDVHDFPTLPRDEIRKACEEADDRLCEDVASAPGDLVIDWGDGITMGPAAHLSNLTSHEMFHHGQMAMAAYVLGVEIPQSWIDSWVLPQSTRA